jgi:hypothetical protein
LCFECIIKSEVVMENRVNELSPGTSPACISCSLWKSGHRHKTLEERIIEFYGHANPTDEEIESSRPRIISWGGIAQPDGEVIWGPPITMKNGEIW